MLLIIKNLEQIKELTIQMRTADPMMFEHYDKFIKHLWEEDEKLKNFVEMIQKKIEERREQFPKALSPMLVTELGIVTEIAVEQA